MIAHVDDASVSSGYRIVLEKDETTQQVIAVDRRDMEICGAYRTHELNHWFVYVTKFASDAVGLPQPKKVHSVSREEAVKWVDMIASLYARSTS